MATATLKVNTKHECAGCGWRWSTERKAPVNVAHLLTDGPRMMVPAVKAPCCMPEAVAE